MKKMTLEINGQEQTAIVQKIKGQLWVHINGKTISYKPEVKGVAGGAGTAVADPRYITAPMPGKIIKVNTEVGHEASEGETLVVMEAMKMEYTLVAAGNGKVLKINCSEGQQVAVGETLVELEVNDG